VRPRRTIIQSVQTLAAASVDLFADSPRANPSGFGDRLRQLPASDLPNNSLSTVPRQTGILPGIT